MAQAGGGAIALEAQLLGSSEPVYWSLEGPGRLTASSGGQVQYQPPSAGAQLVAVDVRVTASSRQFVQSLSIRLQPAPGSPAPVPGTRWEVGSYPKQGFSDLQWIDGRFYLLTSYGGVLSSTDGIVWTPRISSGEALRALALGPVGLLAIGDKTVLKSVDGDVWVKVGTAGSRELWDIASGNGVYVANGLGGLARSTDGADWQSVGPAIGRGRSVAFGAGRFVVSSDGVRVHTSGDGIAWTEQTLPGATTSESTVAYGNGRFVIVTDGGHFTSSDAVTWTRRSAGALTGYKLRFAGGLFYLIGDRDRAIWSSSDGVAWTEVFRTRYVWSLCGMAEHAGRTVVASEIELLHRASTGRFESALPGPSAMIQGMTAIDDTVYAVTFDGKVLRSRDGRSWETRAEGIQAGFRAITYGRGLFVAVSDLGPRAVYTSADGANWTGSDVNLFRAASSSVVFANDTFVVVGGAGEVIRSTNGVTWELLSTPVSIELTGVCYGAGLFVAVSLQGHVIVSSDGRTWTLVAERLGRLQAVAHGPRGFVAVVGWGSPGSGAIWTSPNGLDWTLRPHPDSASLATVVHGGGFYLAAGHQGRILMSEDGVDWAQRDSGLSSPLVASAVMRDRFVVGGAGGAVVFSEQ